jgi:hypothetical protein
MTRRDGLPRFSARSVRRGDAGYRKPGTTLSESLGKPPLRSPLRPARGHGVSPFINGGGRHRGHGVSPFINGGGAPAAPGGVEKP